MEATRAAQWSLFPRDAFISVQEYAFNTQKQKKKSSPGLLIPGDLCYLVPFCTFSPLPLFIPSVSHSLQLQWAVRCLRSQSPSGSRLSVIYLFSNLFVHGQPWSVSTWQRVEVAAGPFITAQNPARLHTDTQRESNMLDDEQTHVKYKFCQFKRYPKTIDKARGADTHQVSRQFVKYLQAGSSSLLRTWTEGSLAWTVSGIQNPVYDLVNRPFSRCTFRERK